MRSFVRIIALAALLAGPLAAHAHGDPGPATAHPAANAADQAKPVPLLEPDVAAKPKATPLSELDVVVTRNAPTKLSGVEVKAPSTCLPPRSPADEGVPAPKLVSSYPRDGQAVQPGFIVLRLTFNLPMACRGSLPGNLLADCFADGIQIWHESVDRKSLLIECNLKAGAHYDLGINRRIPEHFQGLSGNEPENGGFSFDTTHELPIGTAQDMIRRDPQLAPMLAAASNASGPEQTAAAGSSGATVSIMKVQETNRCLQPRNPPDPDVPAPKLVSTFPAQGQVVRPGLLDLRFTFDLPMACVGGVEVKAGAPDPCGQLQTKKTADGGLDSWKTEKRVQTWDRHTMRFVCQVEPGKRYVVFINTAFPKTETPGGGAWEMFQGLGGKSPAPYELTFTTSNDAPVATQDEADDEDPLMAAQLDGRVEGREE